MVKLCCKGCGTRLRRASKLSEKKFNLFRKKPEKLYFCPKCNVF